VIRAFAHDLNLPMTFEVTLDTWKLIDRSCWCHHAQAGKMKH
jgi:hypothetical protein